MAVHDGGGGPPHIAEWFFGLIILCVLGALTAGVWLVATEPVLTAMAVGGAVGALAIPIATYRVAVRVERWWS